MNGSCGTLVLQKLHDVAQGILYVYYPVQKKYTKIVDPVPDNVEN